MHTKTFLKSSGNHLKLIVLLIGLVLPIVLNSSAYAVIPGGGGGADAQWSSYYGITLGSRVFVNDPTSPPYNDPSNNTYVMLYDGTSSDTSCADALMVPFDPAITNSQAALTATTAAQQVPGQLEAIHPVKGQRTTYQCVWTYANPLGYPVTITNTRPTAAVWATQTPPTLLYSGVTYGNATPSCTPNPVTNCTANPNDIILTAENVSGCPPSIEVNPYKTATSATLSTYTNTGGLGGCINPSNTTIAIEYNSYTNAPTTTPPANSTGNTCPITDAGALTWIFCPIYTIGISAVNALSGVLKNFLYVPNVFLTSFQGPTNSFRDFGEALLVIAGLVMVVSQAAGLEIFAAYTVRKALPRIILAAIGIALSGPILQFIVTFFNDLGTWTQALILNAVVPANVNNGVAGVFTTVLGTGGAVVLSIAAIAASALVVLSMIGTLLLALFVGFLVLTIRQLVIVVCLIMAPLAIASAVLPGTDKIWQFWRKAFLSTMIMFPIIMATLGAGLALSYLAGQLAKTEGAAWALMCILALVAPLFLLPFSFALAGGIMASVHGLVNGAHQGAFTRLSKFRQAQVAKRWQDAQTDKFWKTGRFGSGTVGKFADRLAIGGSSGIQRASVFAKDPLNSSKRAGVLSSIPFDQAMKASEENADFAAFSGNDPILWVAMGGKDHKGDTTENGMRQALVRDYGMGEADANRYVGQILRAREAMGERSFNIAAAVAQAGTGTGYNNNKEMIDTLAWASGGDKALGGRMLLDGRGARARGVQSGRLDLGGAGANAYLEQLNTAIDGGTVDIDKLNLAAFNDQDTVSLARQRVNGLKNITESVSGRLQQLKVKAQQSGSMSEEEELEFGRLTAGLEKLGISAREYAAPGRIVVTQEASDKSADAIEAAKSAPVRSTKNEVLGTIDRKGVEGGYQEQRTRYADQPFDPRNPGSPNSPNAPPPPSA